MTCWVRAVHLKSYHKHFPAFVLHFKCLLRWVIMLTFLYFKCFSLCKLHVQVEPQQTHSSVMKHHFLLPSFLQLDAQNSTKNSFVVLLCVRFDELFLCMCLGAMRWYKACNRIHSKCHRPLGLSSKYCPPSHVARGGRFMSAHPTQPQSESNGPTVKPIGK